MKASVNLQFSSFASRQNSSELDSALDLASVATKEDLSSQRSPQSGYVGEDSYCTISELTASATAQREGIDNRPPECAYHLLHVLVKAAARPLAHHFVFPTLQNAHR